MPFNTTPAPLDQFKLTEIEELAALMFSADEVAIIAGIDYRTYAGLDTFQQAMLRGQLKQEAELRTNIFLHAKNGSAPAQTMATQIIERARIKAIQHEA